MKICPYCYEDMSFSLQSGRWFCPECGFKQEVGKVTMDEFAAKCEEALKMLLDEELIAVKICHKSHPIEIAYGGLDATVSAGIVEFTVDTPSFEVNLEEGYEAAINCFNGCETAQATIHIENPECIIGVSVDGSSTLWGCTL